MERTIISVKNGDKIQFLSNKWRPKTHIPETFKGVLISDKLLEEKYDPPTITPINYDPENIILSEPEMKVLNLPPKQTMYETLNLENIAEHCNVLGAKIHWERRAEVERGGKPWSEEVEWKAVQAKTPYHETTGDLNFARKKVTDMETCRRITVPEPGSTEDGMIVSNMTARILKVTEAYMEENCDSRGNIRGNIRGNVDKEIIAGIKSLKESAESGVMVVANDKSGRLAVTSKYVTAMQPHIRDAEVVTMRVRDETERSLNGHCLQLGRILLLGENHRHWPRMKSALRNRSGHVPVLYGMVKDHKKVQPGADEAANAQLSRLLSDIIMAVSDRVDKKVGTMCRSTEEMIAAIEEVNRISDKEDITIFSTEISAMYPLLDIPTVAKVAAEEFLACDLDINLDLAELGLYLAVVKDRQELISLGLGDVCHTRLHSTGRKPGVTTEEILSRTETTVSKFRYPARSPTKEEARLMFSVALEHLIVVAMESHICSCCGGPGSSRPRSGWPP